MYVHYFVNLSGRYLCDLTLALSGTQHAPRSGILLLRVRDEQRVKHHAHPTE